MFPVTWLERGKALKGHRIRVYDIVYDGIEDFGRGAKPGSGIPRRSKLERMSPQGYVREKKSNSPYAEGTHRVSFFYM